MLLETANINPNEIPVARDEPTSFREELGKWFDVEFSIWEAETSKLILKNSDQPQGDEQLFEAITRAFLSESEPRIVNESDNALFLAISLEIDPDCHWVAIAPFLTRSIEKGKQLTQTAEFLGATPSVAWNWIQRQAVWEPESLLKLASAVSSKLAAERQIAQLHNEVEKVSNNLSSTYEEISLLYQITQNLRLTSTIEQFGQQAIDWLLECARAECVAIQFTPEPDERSTNFNPRNIPTMLLSGDCPIDGGQFADLIATISAEANQWPFIANRKVSKRSDWRFPEVREVILAPLSEGDNVHGWIAAINHVESGDFDSVEANLLSSVASILGIHIGNHGLYEDQSKFISSVIRAMTSAIDAKDPYTCGHSDRVAHISVRLARYLGCGPETLKTLYMGGLLHDIGKIGINDSVLRKTGRLTKQEYEHIKQHPELGYRILVDLKQFTDVLPIVLHHHEQWVGRGYPHGLKGIETPLLARICAVADSFDAMSSDRPYRKGMNVKRVEEIFRDGSGTQWDPDIIDAYFAIKQDIYKIARRKRQAVSLDMQWV